MRLKKALFWFSIALSAGLAQLRAEAQTDIFVRIDSIRIEGNRKTRPRVILRELEFQKGDSILVAEQAKILERNRLRLMNIGLFTGATMEIIPLEGRRGALLLITVKESWYFYPTPIFALADRNFNVWWNEFNRSLKRVNYGIDWNQLNLTGRNDALKVKGQFGYNNRYELIYKCPGINPKQTLGIETAVSFSRRHEVAVRTVGNKLDFKVNPDLWLLTEWLASAGLTWRPKLFTSHLFALEYRDNMVADSVAYIFNPDFFLEGASRQRHFSLVYQLTLDYRDIRPYPLVGRLTRLEFRKNGLLPSDDFQHFRAFLEHAHYFKLSKRLYAEVIGKLRVSLPRSRPPYFNNQGLGYGGNFVRGFEYYVVDGLDFGLLKTSLHVELFNKTIDFGKRMLKSYRYLPLKVYFALNNDIGGANDPWFQRDNPLSNRLMYGYGVGLDFILYYNLTVRTEYSWNDLGESGFFLRINSGI